MNTKSNYVISYFYGHGVLFRFGKIFYNTKTTGMSKCITIARYNKNIDWVDDIPNDINVVVYNKGEPIQPLHRNVRIKNVDNIGIDQASHLQYIIDNYDNLPDLVLFAQDDFNRHTEELINIYEMNYSERDVAFYIDLMFKEASLYGHSLNAFAYDYYGVFSPSYGFKLPNCYSDHFRTDLTFGEWFEQNIKTPYPSNFLWFKCAIFAVHKRFILKRPKEFYQNLFKQFQHQRNEIDHFMERSWYYVLKFDDDNLLS